ncbi:hypothetical protein HWV62_15729 [Athelia sp. TMB]|nr:hypothetical protein HWV62_15729 [Athelia sp. TMB]
MAPPPPVDINTLAAPAGSTHYVQRTINAMKQTEIKLKDRTLGTITWSTEAHVYPTGASLDDSNYWGSNGLVHVMIVHRGAIRNSMTWPVNSLTMETTVRNPGAQAKIQLPPTGSGVEDGSDTYCAFNGIVFWGVRLTDTEDKTTFSRRLSMYSGTQPVDANVSIEKTFTRFADCRQESSVAGNVATIRLALRNHVASPYGKWANEHDIYGFSHFTLAPGDYHDIDFEFKYTIDSFAGLASTSVRDSVKVDPISGLSVMPYKDNLESVSGSSVAPSKVVALPGRKNANYRTIAHAVSLPAAALTSAGWKRHGEVQVMIVHRGTIRNDSRPRVEGINLHTTIKNDGARPRMQLPHRLGAGRGRRDVLCATSLFFRHTPHPHPMRADKTTFSRRLPMYSGATFAGGTVSVEKAFTRFKCAAIAAHGPAATATNTLVFQSDEGGKAQEIYGFWHFTLPKGAYGDINFGNAVRLPTSVCVLIRAAEFMFGMVINPHKETILESAGTVEVDPIPELSESS